MDLAGTFDEVVELVTSGDELSETWKRLHSYLADRVGRTVCSSLEAVDVQQDVQDLRGQLAQVFAKSPPSAAIDTIHFGLYDGLTDARDPCIGYYIAGVQGFDPSDADTLCDPAWWPEHRYLNSAALTAIKAAELSASALPGEEAALLGYGGQLGAAILVSQAAVEQFASGRRITVGFDSGDYADLGSQA